MVFLIAVIFTRRPLELEYSQLKDSIVGDKDKVVLRTTQFPSLNSIFLRRQAVQDTFAWTFRVIRKIFGMHSESKKPKFFLQQNSVQENVLFTYRLQGKYIFWSFLVWAIAELLSMRNTAPVKEYFSFDSYPFVEKPCICGVSWKLYSVLLKLLLEHYHISHWQAWADASC